MKLSYVGIAAALAGCSDSVDMMQPPPPGPGARTIRAHDAQTYRAADGTSNAIATDLGRAVIQALVRVDDGSWAVFPGIGLPDGTLEIDDVPAGEAIVRVDYFDGSPEPQVRNEYFWASGDGDIDIDLGTWRAGRSNARHAQTSPTDLELDMSGLAPWQTDNDLAVIYEPNVDFVNFFSQDVPDAVSGMPVAGATSSQLHVDWVNAVGGPLADGDLGDRAYLMQFRFRMMGNVLVGAPVSAVALAPFVQIDGQPTVVAAPLDSSTPLHVRIAMDRDAFDAQRAAINPSTGPASERGFAIASTSGDVATDFSPLSLPAELVSFDSAALQGTGLFDLGDIDVASPLPAASTYGRYISVYPVPIARDDGLVADASAQIGVITNELPTQGSPAAPLISPVRAITVAGKDAFSSPTGVGLTPEIAWQPPAIGTPIEYEVRVLAPGGADSTFGFLWYAASTFHVPADRTSFTLPAETLVAGIPYALAIRAITTPLTADQHAATPRRLALPYGWADTFTTEFHP